MAAEIKKAFGLEPDLIPKGRGIFDVSVDGVLIYSKYETGSFPQHEQVLEKIRELI